MAPQPNRSRRHQAHAASPAGEPANRHTSVAPAQASAFKSAYNPSRQGTAAAQAFSRQKEIGRYARTNPQYAHARRGLSRGKKIALGILIALAVVMVAGGTALALYVNSINQSLSGTKSSEELEAIDQALTGGNATSFTKPFYMMLIGSDDRMDDASMGARSDTNILVRIDPATNKVTMVSIPRDTAIPYEGYGTVKFNAAYAYGGVAGTIRAASQLCDVDISHYAQVNFEGLIDLVDAVGGVDVQVDERIDDPDAGPVVIEEGMQHLDGEAALVFCRSRAYADGDFTRVSNQRKLITAVVEKVMKAPVTQLPSIISAAAHAVSTDLSLQDIIAMAQQFRNTGALTIYSATVPSSTGSIGDVSYVFASKKSLAEMMRLVEAGKDPAEFAASADVSDAVGPGGGVSSSGSLAGPGGYGSTSVPNGSAGGAYGGYAGDGWYGAGGAADSGAGTPGLDAGAGAGQTSAQGWSEAPDGNNQQGSDGQPTAGGAGADGQ